MLIILFDLSIRILVLILIKQKAFPAKLTDVLRRPKITDFEGLESV